MLWSSLVVKIKIKMQRKKKSSSVPSTKQHLETLLNLLWSSLLVITHKTWYVLFVSKMQEIWYFKLTKLPLAETRDPKWRSWWVPDVSVHLFTSGLYLGRRRWHRDHARLDDSNMKLSVLFNSLPTLVELLRVVDSSTREHFSTNPGCN